MALATRELALDLRRSFEAGERRKFALDAFEPLMFKGVERGWNELSALMAKDTKRLQQVFAPPRPQQRFEAAE